MAIILGVFKIGIGGLPPLFSLRVLVRIIELWELAAIFVQIFNIR